MITNDMTIVIGGDAGQGVESTGSGLCQSLVRGGLHIFGRQDYRSQIRGGHNFFEIRIKDEEIHSHTGKVDILIALTPETVSNHLAKVVEGGGVVYDERFEIDESQLRERGIVPLPTPLHQIALDEGGAKVMANTAAVGALAGLTNFDLGHITGVIEDNFKSKGEEIVDNNINVARAGYEYWSDSNSGLSYELRSVSGAPPRMVIDGNHAFALGAVASGCNFISAYPMTPSTSIFEYLTSLSPRYGVVSKQTESELAAINMALGASHVGARALVTTSGGGFSLMVEGLGLAGMTETPVVIAEVQRPGPSTGLPTRTEQSDLLFVLNASQGEFPRIVLTPGSTREYFQAGTRSFNLAEKYQVPVIVLADQFLADSLRTVDPDILDMESVEIDRGELLDDDRLEELKEDYLRFKFTSSGISPRAVLPHPKAVYTATGNEHDEKGDITEDSSLRTRMVEKRWKKLAEARKEIEDPVFYGPEDADYTFLGWGSTFGPLLSAVQDLTGSDASVNYIHFSEVWPFPVRRTEKLLQLSQYTIAVENNHTGQLAQLIEGQTGEKVDYRIGKVDGRPFTPGEIKQKFKQIREGTNG